MKAIIPASGDGVRMKNILNGMPKELANINDRPLIWYAIEECCRSGIKSIIIIVSEKKVELIQYLSEVIPIFDENGIIINVIKQKIKNGSGGALLSARDVIGDDDFCVLFSDVFIHEECSNLKKMRKVFSNICTPIVLVDKISDDALDRYGITIADRMNDGCYNIEYMIEKPRHIPKTSFYHGVIGRYVFPNSFFDELEKVELNDRNEIDLSEALVNTKKKTAVLLQGQHYECGSADSYLKSVKSIKKINGVDRL